ncbi:PIG-L family deacetylase [Pseudomonas sp. HR96]|uniref:PIG-L deacetylase family protein n=1 Tax=Pseudomonas sp. HR96 TaxID=1027966 RepID=UPI002A765D55|nr:PIG-L family deacetylase [Pseudomonas sp. HR96]WPO99570.1 PIG-L family deacetylase [Pseudomonas sp. HR96]
MNGNPSRKQQLLKRHRRNKRVALLVALVVLVLAGVLVAWWLPLVLAVLLWVAHEAWFADHLFYAPGDDYQYAFAPSHERAVLWREGRLLLAEPLPVGADDTLIVEVRLASRAFGRFLDPYVSILGGAVADAQAFERGVRGVRYLNLTGEAAALAGGQIQLAGRHCRIVGQPRLWVFPHDDLRQRRVMVIAPHADDAELAAFGLYSQAAESWIVTLTAGEIEADHYQAMGMSRSEAAQTKGRLRAWDSIAVPLWGGVPAERCVQLGYFCLQLPAMQAAPDVAVASREAELADTRLFRQFNRLRLASDVDGAPTWHNLLADLRELILLARPEVIVLPQAGIDPHPDHICAQEAVLEALQGLAWQPQTLLGYANHLHDNDRWPMGNAHTGVSLPPLFQADASLRPYCLALAAPLRRDKAMALGMQHDLQPPAPFKRRLRRWLQRHLAGRRWAAEGENEFFRKAVRRHELFWRTTPGDDKPQG